MTAKKTTEPDSAVPENVPGPDDEIQVTGHVLGPGDGEKYKGPDQEQVKAAYADDDKS